MSRRRDDRVVTEKRSFIVKIAPQEESTRRNLIEKSSIFHTEIKVMVDTLRKMNDLLGPEHPLSGRVFHVQREYPEFLMIEDLAILGFRMAHRQAGLDLDHCLVALRGLARFHASSVAVCEKEPNTKQLYNKAVYCSQQPSEVKTIFIQATKSLVREARKWQELDQKYVDKIEKISDVIYDKTADAVVLREDRFNVINHGDMWVNNMMFRYNDEGKPIAVIFISTLVWDEVPWLGSSVPGVGSESSTALRYHNDPKHDLLRWLFDVN
ncbi:hypothetical protein KPH14_012560 [Odynerus spinipes]|uniref:CHK kinase-like domain-containing protein n=1 Tax=Odynerus spinipes TaxID=1348599 RepID=A0AAD9RG42_9HYME|nr:hypothetical protein KPH14_012560 [Odynerus spinipes]